MNTGETIALIKAFGGGSSLPPVTPSDNGKVLAVEDGAWAAEEPNRSLPSVDSTDNGKMMLVHELSGDGHEAYDWEKNYPLRDGNLRRKDTQVIPFEYSYVEGEFLTDITPNDIWGGYTVDDVVYPSYYESSFTKADFSGLSIQLYPIHGNTDGVMFQSMVFPLDDFGMTGYIGHLVFEPYSGANNPYKISLVAWQGQIMTSLTPAS